MRTLPSSNRGTYLNLPHPPWKLKLKEKLKRNPFELFPVDRIVDFDPEEERFKDAEETVGVLHWTKRARPKKFLWRGPHELNEHIKKIPFARWSDAQQGWFLPVLWITFWILQKYLKGFYITPEALEQAKRGWRQGRKELALLRYLNRLKQDKEPYQDVTGYKIQPRIYQQQGIKFAEAAWSMGYGVAFYDEQGLGKTCMALIALDRYFAKNPDTRVFIFAPKSTLRNVWVQEIAKFSKYLRPLVLDHGNPWQRAQKFCEATYYDYTKMVDGETEHVQIPGAPNCFIVNHEGAAKRKRDDENDFNELVTAMCDESADFIIIDEVHKLQNKNAARTQGIMKIAQNCRYRLGMTGTPGLPHQLWSQFLFIDPRMFPVGKDEFERRYMKEIRAGVMVVNREFRRLPELKKRMGNYSIRRLQAEVYPNIPDSIDIEEKIELLPKQKQMYKDLVDETMTYFESNLITKASISARTHALRNITSGHIKEDLGEDKRGKKIFKKHRIADNAKAKRLFEILDQELGVADIYELEIHRKAMISCAYLEDVALLVDLLKQKKIKHVVITGDVTDDKDLARTKAVNKWVEDPSVQVLVGIGSTFGIGLNLVPKLPAMCNLMFFYSCGYDPRLHDQIKKRIQRSADAWDELIAAGKQPQKIRFIYLVGKGTYDETVVKILKKKQNVQDIITGDNMKDAFLGRFKETA